MDLKNGIRVIRINKAQYILSNEEKGYVVFVDREGKEPLFYEVGDSPADAYRLILAVYRIDTTISHEKYGIYEYDDYSEFTEYEHLQAYYEQARNEGAHEIANMVRKKIRRMGEDYHFQGLFRETLYEIKHDLLQGYIIHRVNDNDTKPEICKTATLEAAYEWILSSFESTFDIDREDIEENMLNKDCEFMI